MLCFVWSSRVIRRKKRVAEAKAQQRVWFREDQTTLIVIIDHLQLKAHQYSASYSFPMGNDLWVHILSCHFKSLWNIFPLGESRWYAIVLHLAVTTRFEIKKKHTKRAACEAVDFAKAPVILSFCDFATRFLKPAVDRIHCDRSSWKGSALKKLEEDDQTINVRVQQNEQAERLGVFGQLTSFQAKHFVRKILLKSWTTFSDVKLCILSHSNPAPK